MSYMSTTEFAPATGIQELTFNEIDYVAGGPGPLAPIAAGAAACAKNKTAGIPLRALLLQ